MPTRASSYQVLTDDQLLCHLGNHALSWPTMWQGPHPTRHMPCWCLQRVCDRCGAVRREYLQIGTKIAGSRTLPPRLRIGQAGYEHRDGYLMQGGRDQEAARVEMFNRSMARQELQIDSDGYVVDGDMPDNVREMSLPRSRARKIKTRVTDPAFVAPEPPDTESG